MATNRELVQKLARRAKYVKEKLRGRKYDRIDERQAVLQKSPRAYDLARKPQRRFDRNYQEDVIAQKPVVSFAFTCPNVNRQTYGLAHGIRIKLPLVNAGLPEKTNVTTVADTGVFEIDTLTFPALAGAGPADYVVFKDTAGLSYAAALNTTGTDSAPTGATWTAIPSGRKVFVDISGATTAADVAGLVKTALHANSAFLAAFTDGTVAGGDLPITSKTFGAIGFVPTGHNFDDSGAGSITGAASTPGHASNLNNTYFYLDNANDQTKYYVWNNIASQGTDPMVAGRTGIMVASAASAGANTVASNLSSAVGAVSSSFTTSVLANVVQITDANNGMAIDAHDGAVPTGFGIVIGQQGTNPSSLQSAVGIQPGDWVYMLAGAAKGQYLQVVALDDNQYVRLDDYAAFGSPETNVAILILLSSEKASYL